MQFAPGGFCLDRDRASSGRGLVGPSTSRRSYASRGATRPSPISRPNRPPHSLAGADPTGCLSIAAVSIGRIRERMVSTARGGISRPADRRDLTLTVLGRQRTDGDFEGSAETVDGAGRAARIVRVSPRPPRRGGLRSRPPLTGYGRTAIELDLTNVSSGGSERTQRRADSWTSSDRATRSTSTTPSPHTGRDDGRDPTGFACSTR